MLKIYISLAQKNYYSCKEIYNFKLLLLALILTEFKIKQPYRQKEIQKLIGDTNVVTKVTNVDKRFYV